VSEARNMILSAKLRELVEGQGMTVPAAAAALGVSRRSADHIVTRDGITRPARVIPLAQREAATAASQAKAAAARAELAERLKALMAQHNISLHDAAIRCGVNPTRAYRLRAEFDIRLDRDAGRQAVVDAQKRRHAAERGRDGALLVELEKLRPTGMSLGAAATQLHIGNGRACRIWNAAHPGLAYSLIGAGRLPRPKPAAPIPSAAVRVMNAAMNSKHPSQMTEEERAERDNAIAHAKRTAVLPPVAEDEAARLVAEFMARRGVTRCEPGFAAVVNNNTGL